MRSDITQYFDIVQIHQPVSIVYHEGFSVGKINEAFHLFFETFAIVPDGLHSHHLTHVSSSGWISDHAGAAADQGDWFVAVSYTHLDVYKRQALYGIRANDLSKFAPPAQTETARREGGEYYTAYFDLINQIKPGKGAREIITPHLDREWHLISKMPDLDEGNQKQIEKGIYKAMILGLIFGKIVYRPIVENERYYRIAIGEETQDFIVSNHTPCDNFFEILDALTINPTIVKMILQSVEEDIKFEKLRKINFDRTLLKTRLEKFKLVEFSGNVQSIFDLAMLLKVSTPAEEFYEEDGKEFVRAALDIVYEYMAQFCPKQKMCIRDRRYRKEAWTFKKRECRNE